MRRINTEVVIVVAVAIAVLFVGLLIVAPSSAKAKKSPSTVFSNPQSVTINSAGTITLPTVADPYPSTINVSGMTGTITNVDVTLTGVTQTRLNDLDVLLVSPTGAKFIFLSDSPPTSPEQNVVDRTYTFSDNAAAVFPLFGDPVSGTYRPRSGDGVADTFPAPAPAGPYALPPGATFASVFNGADPNGAWSVYVVDDTTGSAGSITSGWGLTITTSGAPVTFTNNGYIVVNDITRPSTPYGTPVTVSGMTGVVTDVNVTITGFTHPTPNSVDMLLINPDGKGLVLMSDAGGTTAASNANLTFDDAAASTLSIAVTGTYRVTDINPDQLDTFPAPAPYKPYLPQSSPLSNFDGSSPNGQWRLFVINDAGGSGGSISGGWSLDITTAPPGPEVPLTCFVPSFASTSFGAGVNPTNVAVADLNNDTKPDLAVTNQVSNDVSILLGNGDGTFSAQTPATAGTGPYAVVAGKFNADTNFDLAVVNSTSNSVSILLGNGNGTFSAATNYFTGSSPISIATGDLNNDTFLDLAIANFGSFFSGSVSILLGSGTGTFAAANSVRTRTQPAFVHLTDLDANATKDLIVASFGSNSVSTFFGQGDGTFALSQNLTVGPGPVAVETVDLTGDSAKELVVANYNGDTVSTCLGNVNGTFSSCGQNGGYGPNPVSLASGDFIGSGSTSTFAVALNGSDLVTTQSRPTDFIVGQNPNALVTADFNGDGKPDLVSVNSGSNDVSILLNDCKVALGNFSDFNGDRRTDYAIYRPSSTQWWVQGLNNNNPTASFGHPTDLVLSADFDGDRFADLGYFRPDSGIWVVINRSLRPIHHLQFGMAGDIPVPADYDGDTRADLAVFRPSEGRFYVRRSTDNSVDVIIWGTNGDKPVPADYDGDGKDDIAVYRPSVGTWFIVQSSNGQFVTKLFGIAEDRTVVGDYDGDDKADIAVWRPSTGVWWVLRSSDDGFSAFAFGAGTDIPLVGDFEGDGKYDYAVWRPSDGIWYVWRQQGQFTVIFSLGNKWGYPYPVDTRALTRPFIEIKPGR